MDMLCSRLVCSAVLSDIRASWHPLLLSEPHCSSSPKSWMMGFILAAIIDARVLYVTSSRQTGRHLFGFDRSPFFGTGVSVPILHSDHCFIVSIPEIK